MMATATSKQRIVTNLFSALGKGVKPREHARPVLEQFLFALCREGATAEQADQAYRRLQERFFDWNEIRVSSPREVAEILEPFLGDADARAQRIIDFLQEVFETTFSFDLESLHKKGVKQAAKQLGRYQSANDYAVAWVVQHSLGGHAIPLDAPSLRALRRLGLIEEGINDFEALRASLEHQIPKAKGPLFVDMVSHVAEGNCWETDPACVGCPLANHCPTGLELKSAAVAATTKKPR